MVANCECSRYLEICCRLTEAHQVPEDSDKSGKTPFVDFKRVVWHSSVHKILEPFLKLVGLPYIDVYGILRLLFPIILIIAADFEEQ